MRREPLLSAAWGRDHGMMTMVEVRDEDDGGGKIQGAVSGFAG